MSRALLLVASFCLFGFRLDGARTEAFTEADAVTSDSEFRSLPTGLMKGLAHKMARGKEDKNHGELFATWATCTWGVTATTKSTKDITQTCFSGTDTNDIGVLGAKSNVFIVDFAGDSEVWSEPTFGGYDKPQDLPIKETLRRVSGEADLAGSEIDYPNWMARLRPEPGITVRDILVPGSHDAVCLTDGSATWSDGIAATQTKSLTEQLDAGFRWFDLRLALKDKVWTGIHPNAAAQVSNSICTRTSQWYTTADVYINEVSTWLEAHKEEIVFLRIKPACGTDAQLLDQIQTCGEEDKEGKSLGCLFGKAPTYRSHKSPIHPLCGSLACRDISEMRGKIVPLIYTSALDESDDTFPYWKYTKEYSGKASMKKSFEDTLKTQLTNFEKWEARPE